MDSCSGLLLHRRLVRCKTILFALSYMRAYLTGSHAIALRPTPLPTGLRDAIRALCVEGDAFAAGGYYDEAIADYRNAWALIPAPQILWFESVWVLGALADACFLSGKPIEARQALEYARQCPNGTAIPFLNLRLGQLLYDAGEEGPAATLLMQALREAGPDIFVNEDGRYLAFLKARGLVD